MRRGTLAVAAAEVERLLDFNVLETVLLASCVAVVLGGMMFGSARFPPGSPAYIALTVAVAAIIVASVCLFVWMLAKETRRTCGRGAPRGAGAPSAALARGASERLSAALGTVNPIAAGGGSGTGTGAAVSATAGGERGASAYARPHSDMPTAAFSSAARSVAPPLGGQRGTQRLRDLFESVISVANPLLGRRGGPHGPGSGLSDASVAPPAAATAAGAGGVLEIQCACARAPARQPAR